MKVINLFAGPCTGKTTLTHELMWRMKKMDLKCEFIGDLPRDDVFAESWKKLNDHLFQASQLQHRLNMLKDVGVDFVVMESPILMRMAYAQEEPKHIQDLIIGLHNQQDSLNINLLRNPNFKYDEIGRDQTYEQAIERSKLTTELVFQHIKEPLTVMAGVAAGSYILKELGYQDDISILEFGQQRKSDAVVKNFKQIGEENTVRESVENNQGYSPKPFKR